MNTFTPHGVIKSDLKAAKESLKGDVLHLMPKWDLINPQRQKNRSKGKKPTRFVRRKKDTHKQKL